MSSPRYDQAFIAVMDYEPSYAFGAALSILLINTRIGIDSLSHLMPDWTSTLGRLLDCKKPPDIFQEDGAELRPTINETEDRRVRPWREYKRSEANPKIYPTNFFALPEQLIPYSTHENRMTIAKTIASAINALSDLEGSPWANILMLAKACGFTDEKGDIIYLKTTFYSEAALENRYTTLIKNPNSRDLEKRPFMDTNYLLKLHQWFENKAKPLIDAYYLERSKSHAAEYKHPRY